MKIITILLILLNISYFSYSQELDKIYLKNKEVVSGKILNVTSNNIEIDPEGSKPFMIIKRNDAEVIIYSDNTVVNFENSDIKSVQSAEKESLHHSIQAKSPFPITEEDILKRVIDTLKNYEIFYNDLNYNFDFQGLGSYPFYYNTSKILKLKIKSIKTSYSVSLKVPQTTLKYNEIWEYSKNGKLISETTYSGMSKKTNQTIYKWDSSSKLISIIKYSSGGWFLSPSTETTYYTYVGDTILMKEKDERGRLKELSLKHKNIRIRSDTESDDISISILQKKNTEYELLQYVYDKNKKLKYYKNRYILNNDDKISNTYDSDNRLSLECVYNKKGLLSKKISYFGKTKYVQKIFYNKKGLVNRTISGSDVRNYSYEFY